jgi:hypothetical protein
VSCEFSVRLPFLINLQHPQGSLKENLGNSLPSHQPGDTTPDRFRLGVIPAADDSDPMHGSGRGGPDIRLSARPAAQATIAAPALAEAGMRAHRRFDRFGMDLSISPELQTYDL